MLPETAVSYVILVIAAWSTPLQPEAQVTKIYWQSKIRVNSPMLMKCEKRWYGTDSLYIFVLSKKKGRTQCRELPLCAVSGEGCQWQALPSHVQCEETATRTRDLSVTGGKTLPLAPGPPFTFLF